MTDLPANKADSTQVTKPVRPVAADQAAAGAKARRGPRLLPTILASVASFAVLLEFLAFQLASGHDPALGSTPIVAAKEARRAVIDRRIVQTRVVHLPPKSEAGGSAVPVSSGSAPSAAPAAAPASAPVPVSAPAPAAAPAPVTASS